MIATYSSIFEFADLLRNLEPFKTYGSLYATKIDDPSCGSAGRLDLSYLPSLAQADYVVNSYATPIAWHMRDGQWVVPDEYYSITTRRHQNKILASLGFMDVEITS